MGRFPEIDIKIKGLDDALGLHRVGRNKNRFRCSSRTYNPDVKEQRIAMIRDLAGRLLWPFLGAVMHERLSIEELHAAYRQGVTELNRLLERVESQPLDVLVKEYIAQKGTRNKAEEKKKLDRLVEYLGEGCTTADLTTSKIRSFVGGLEVSNATKNRYLACIQGFCTWLVEENHLQVHPFSGKAIKRYEEERGRINLLSNREKRLYIEHMREHRPEALLFFKTLMWSGADVGELIPTERTSGDVLRVRDIINNSAQPRLKLKRHKVRRSYVRLVPIPKRLCEELLEHCRANDLDDGDMVFDGLTNAVLRDAHQYVRAKIGREDFRRKDFRHVAAVQWLQSGFTLQDVQQFLGHTNIKQTLIYTAFEQKDDWQEPRVERAWQEYAGD